MNPGYLSSPAWWLGVAIVGVPMLGASLLVWASLARDRRRARRRAKARHPAKGLTRRERRQFTQLTAPLDRDLADAEGQR